MLDDKALAAGGYGGLIGVGQGSVRGPRLVKVSYSPSRPKVKVALVGKGITFDSGGISIKPAAGMEAMKSDMAGAAAVLHTVVAAARLELPVAVTGWLCLAENMPSGTAQRPSDVLTIRGGKTVEVLNTDAEGRLVMADGLVAAVEEKPDVVIDIATLTGAQLVALGHRVSAVMGTDDVRGEVVAAAEASGEQFWPMPLPADLRAGLKSKVADLANIGDRFGGMLTAGIFLQEFVGSDAVGPPRHRRTGVQRAVRARLHARGRHRRRRADAAGAARGSRADRPASRSGVLALAGEPLPRVPVPDALRVAGPLHVVHGDAHVAGQLARRSSGPAPGGASTPRRSRRASSSSAWSWSAARRTPRRPTRVATKSFRWASVASRAPRSVGASVAAGLRRENRPMAHEGSLRTCRSAGGTA